MTAHQDDWDRDEREALAGVEDQLAVIRDRHRHDPPLELLRAARADLLPAELQSTLNQHLAESAWSRGLADSLAHDEAALEPEAERRLLARITREAGRAPGGARGWTWLRPAFLGSALAASALILWFALRGPAEVVGPSPVPESTQAATQPPEAAPFQLPFDKPDVRLSMSALTWRGTSSDNRLLADLKPALDAYREDNYQAAEKEFGKLAARYPDTIEIVFYQAVTRLYLGDAAGAIPLLAAAETLADAAFIEDVLFYRAVAEQRAGRTTEALARLDALCKQNRQGGPRACTALGTLESGVPSSAK